MQTSVRPVRAADVMPVHGSMPSYTRRGRQSEPCLHPAASAVYAWVTLRGQNELTGSRVLTLIAPFRDGGTQWMVLSATVNKRRSAARHGGTGSGVDGSDGAIVRNSTSGDAFEPTTHTTSLQVQLLRACNANGSKFGCYYYVVQYMKPY